MPLAGDVDQRGAKVDTHAISRLEGRERISDAASDFKNARILRDQKPQIGFILAMKECCLVTPLRARGSVFLRMGQYLRFARGQ